ncbi:hypothetical protein GobsT_15210 [Gemmata obscuriglobus]|nr:hypothetical protein GobsT_15210 [Gemmata obscuriglobus]VTS02612.1 secreted protein containing duf1501 : Secreted protein containing DUF1501 OS=uncultured microorganism GN=LDC_03303 PE=4 SV=1: DUF1501 [Gemmata obscuriglobus UQM 2246]
MHPSRRGFVRSAVAGSLIMPGLLAELLAADSADPLAPKKPHFAPKAKSVIFLFMSGGVSHVDSFDPKPKLVADHGKQVTFDHPETRNRPGYEKLFLKKPNWKFAPRGKSGTEVSDLFPHLGQQIDDVALVRSMHTSHSNHYNATLGMHTGSFAFARPSIGAWTSYGLGTPNKNLPSFLVLAPQMPYAGTQVWAADFLPGAHQGTRVVPGTEPIANLKPRVPDAPRQQLELDALKAFNEAHRTTRADDPALAARIRSFETAFGMQSEMPDALDLSKEDDKTLALYGLSRGQTSGFGWQCLVARRLVERGVRFVELIHTGSSGNWDSHGDMADHGRLAQQVDRPIAGLLQDLKRTGLLDDVLVVWTTEFGRTPFNNTADNPGREHHNWAFSSWLAGAGVKRGYAHGATDEYGMKPVEKPVHVHDFHATILHLMGLDHTKLTYRHAGRDYRLTDVHGEVVRDLLT